MGSQGRNAASAGSRTSTCFLCRKEIRPGTKYDINSCDGLFPFLQKEGLLPTRPLRGGGEEVCRACLADLWKLEEPLSQERDIKKGMSQTAKDIRSRAQQSGQIAASRSRASACFLCRKEIRPGTKYDVNSCNGLSPFLRKEGLLPTRPLRGGGEEVCRPCLSDLWELEELINKEREIRDQMNQTANVIKSRVQPNDQSGAGSDGEKASHDGDSVGEDQQPATDSEEDEVFYVLSEDEDAIKQESGADKSSEAPSSSEHDEPKSPSMPSSLDSEDGNAVEAVEPSSESEEEQPSDVVDMDEDFEAPSTTSSDEDDDQIQALLAGRKSKGPYFCKVEGCKTVLKSKTGLYAHFRIHNYRPFRCPKRSCKAKAAFSDPYSLNAHIRISHQNRGNGRPFRCDFPGCKRKRGFATRQSLYMHDYVVHKGKTAKTCDLCGRRLKTARSLETHRARHFKKVKFPCNREGCGVTCDSEEWLEEHVRLCHPS